MKYESSILKRLIDTYGVIGNPRYLSEIIKEFIVRGKELYPQLFTYQSDWLAHIDEFGLTPEYTVSYTGQSIYAPNTLERPVKSAILKGQTLVNLTKKLTSENIGDTKIWRVEGNGRAKYSYDANKGVTMTNAIDGSMVLHYMDNSTFKPNTEYTLFVEVNWNGVGVIPSFSKISTTEIKLNNGLNIVKFTTLSDLTVQGVMPRFGYSGTMVSGCEYTFNNIMIIEGDYTNQDIHYFEGMQSVKMPGLKTVGKNLYNKEIHQRPSIMGANSELFYGTDYIPVLPNTTYTKSNNTRYELYDINKTLLNGANGSTFTTTSDTHYIRYNVLKTEIDTHQLEQGSTATPYEPYKSNILTVNDDVTLRGIGDVKDELNLLTGEVTERIGEVVLDGSENDWYIRETNDVTIRITNDSLFNAKNINCYCDTIKVSSQDYQGENDVECLCIRHNLKGVGIRINKSRLSTLDDNGLKQWLSQNPITVQYEFATESVKTVELSILDQNENKVSQLSSFNGGTHFSTSSQEGSLQPTISVEVVTDLETTLMGCSLEGNTM